MVDQQTADGCAVIRLPPTRTSCAFSDHLVEHLHTPRPPDEAGGREAPEVDGSGVPRMPAISGLNVGRSSSLQQPPAS